MHILSQDRDVIFNFNRFSRIYAQDKYFKGKYYGTNIFGRSLFKKHLLGTYEDGEAQQVVTEIYQLLRIGQRHYKMPDVALDLSELFDAKKG